MLGRGAGARSGGSGGAGGAPGGGACAASRRHAPVSWNPYTAEPVYAAVTPRAAQRMAPQFRFRGSDAHDCWVWTNAQIPQAPSPAIGVTIAPAVSSPGATRDCVHSSGAPGGGGDEGGRRTATNEQPQRRSAAAATAHGARVPPMPG